MPSNSPVAPILGAGANIGQNVARVFAAKGYHIALAARSLREADSTPDQLHIQSDFSDSTSISEIFAAVKPKLGSPHVVVYNGTYPHCPWAYRSYFIFSAFPKSD